MPESFAQVTSSGALKMHTFNRTIGANSVEDEAVFLGEQPYPTYMVNAGSISTATGASHTLQIMAGASLNVYIRRVWMFQQAVATTAAIGRLVLIRLSSAGTGGTAVTPAPYDTTDTAGATGMTLPTVKGTETTQIMIAGTQFTQTVPTGGNFAGPLLFLDFTGPRSKSLRIPAGAANGIAFKNNDAIAAASVNLMVEIVELNY